MLFVGNGDPLLSSGGELISLLTLAGKLSLEGGESGGVMWLMFSFKWAGVVCASAEELWDCKWAWG